MGKIVIGIDQSYKRTGITIMQDNEIYKTFSVDYEYCKNNSEKRVFLENRLWDVVEFLESNNPLVIVERIRLRSQGFLSEPYIKSTGALIATIVDFFYYWNEIPVYSVDTRAWKSAIIGTSKAKENKYGIDPHKWPTIL